LTIFAAAIGVIIGARLLKKVDIKFIKYLVSASLLVLGFLIAAGII